MSPGEKQEPRCSPFCPSASPKVDCTSSLFSSAGKGTSWGQSVGVVPFLKMRCGETSAKIEQAGKLRVGASGEG